MNIKQNTDITFKWFEAFNEHNIEKLLALYDNGADHYSPKLKMRFPETKGLIKGKDALRNWWTDSFERLPTLHYEIISLTVEADFVLFAYKRKVNNEEDMQVREVLNIKNGLIVSSAVLE